MRALAPADSLVYLETNDLAAALQPIVDSKPFNEVAKYKPDLSALKGVQLAVAVTGFEASEEKVNDEISNANIRPRFVAIADTHAWNFQAVKFAEQKLGGFVAKIYDGEPTLEKSDKNGGKYFKWTAADGRKAYALVVDSLIYFGNDESSIDKCLAVRRGEADSIIKPGNVQPADPQTLARGYISTDGVAQIANVLALKLAAEASDESEVQSAIASIVPQLLRNTMTDVAWKSTKTGENIADEYAISMPAEVSGVLSETMASNGEAPPQLFSNLPDGPSTTRYNLKDSRTAWRSVVFLCQKQVDPAVGRVLSDVSNALFEPYGIRKPEDFLKAVDSNILTTNANFENDEPLVTATVLDRSELMNSLVSGLKPNKWGRTEEGVLFWVTEGDDIKAVIDTDRVIIGSTGGVGSCFSAGAVPGTTPEPSLMAQLVKSQAPITTIGKETESVGSIVGLMSEAKDARKTRNLYETETRFTKTGIERRTVSDFGLIGWIIAQLNEE